MDVITTHQHADFDGMASMIAAKKLYPKAVMAFSGSQEKNIRDFFVQSAAYLYDFQRIKNIALDKINRLIIVDTRQASRIGKFAECLNNPDLEIHLFDHHPDAPGDLKGSYEVIRPVGSTATIFSQIFEEKNIAITKDDATLLGMAIYEDTGAFTFDTTTPEDMAAMAWLLKQGANLQTIAQFISQELSVEQVAILHELIKSATTYTIQGIDIVVTKLSTPDYVDDFSLLVRRFMMMENLNTLFAIARMGNKIYLVARSRIPEVNAGKIAVEFGGGGHASAASAAIKDMTLIEAEEKLLHLLHKHVRPQSVARELMSAPVIYVRPDLTINEANNALTRYSLTVLPVLNEEQKILGIISRRVTEKAIFHGLGSLPVSDYMTTDFATLPPSATLADIQELAIEHRQRFIPVVENEVIRGVITRTDLLNLLVNDPANLPKNLLTGKNLPSTERFRNLSNLMASTLQRDTIVLLRTIGETAAANSYTAYVVGGFVRDLLLHIPNLDLDIVIEGDGIDFARKLALQLHGKVRPHEKFSTAVVILKDGSKIDVATARLEYYEFPAAMPTVELSSIKLDLYRRDFTINAMAIHLNPDKFGTLVDFFNCQNDIKDRQIRILHNLSFVEDPTRILRAIRFEQRMGFSIGKHTEKLIKNAVRMKVFDRFYGLRFFIELKLILSEENGPAAIERMAEFNLLPFFLSGLRLDQRLAGLLKECQRALSWHRLLYLDEKCRQWLVYLLALLSFVPGKKILDFFKKFEVPERYRQVVFQEKMGATKIVRILNSRAHFTNSEIYWLLQELSHEGLLYLMALTKRKSGKKAVSLYVTHLRHAKTEIQGDDLIRMGYSPGPIFKKILTALLDARLDGLVQDRDEEAAFVKKNFPQKTS
jgi:tRNA nucleotidyltransferase (CCA-adding enzyme)